MPAPTHDHEDRLVVRPLPACLAPTPAESDEHAQDYRPYIPAARLPREGEPVVFEGGHVTWLVVRDDVRPVTDENSILFSAGRLVTGECGDVQWSQAYGVDPQDPNLEEEDAAALPEVRDLLIAHANAALTGDRS